MEKSEEHTTHDSNDDETMMHESKPEGTSKTSSESPQPKLKSETLETSQPPEDDVELGSPEISDDLEEQEEQEEAQEPVKPIESNPASYTFRDLLLLTQILHTLGLIEPKQVLQSPDLDECGETWFNHKCTVLARRLGEFPLHTAATSDQVKQLYENMLQDFSPCQNTTELANSFYHMRIRELETKILEEKDAFETLHNVA
ncbi:hypothetical protein PUMCH_000319 [Australozyma saopauloensis]|uniref:Uncharacterized protein n=1 Tax=Australozyma saopauloensis TaxID=291208 RepID=A0AAX4H4G6_9ASCO|nr:hypothetical protein PUMCH_000319 [[Candida] saopauloensis]